MRYYSAFFTRRDNITFQNEVTFMQLRQLQKVCNKIDA